MIKLNDLKKTILDPRKIDLLSIDTKTEGCEYLNIVISGVDVGLNYYGEKPLCEYDYGAIKKAING